MFGYVRSVCRSENTNWTVHKKWLRFVVWSLTVCACACVTVKLVSCLMLIYFPADTTRHYFHWTDNIQHYFPYKNGSDSSFPVCLFPFLVAHVAYIYFKHATKVVRNWRNKGHRTMVLLLILTFWTVFETFAKWALVIMHDICVLRPC
jgi:hypothetical protein